MRSQIVVIVLAALGALSSCSNKKKGVVRVAAASDLAFAFKEIEPLFEKKTGKRVDIILGSTGQFAQKIGENAPYDVFFAANLSFIDDVIKSGDCDAGSKQLYARGRVVIWSKGEPPKSIGDLPATQGKIAIANPDHAPYGRAAKQAMESAGVWEQVKDRIVFGNNIQHTMQLAQSGNAPVAVIALALALGADEGKYTEIDESLHKPLDQALAVCKHGSAADGGREFAEFVMSAEGRTIMKRYGFRLPGE
jgi:molybdate transport system substrate-binding protein